MRYLRMLAMLALVLVPACGTEIFEHSPDTARLASTAAVDYNVVIFMIDGPRWTETFGDTTHTYTDQMWNVLRPQGALCTNFRNSGMTVTMPGHCTTVTGTQQTVANDGSERPTMPTIFEYLRKATGAPQSDAIIVGGKPKLASCSYSVHVDYGAAYGAGEDVGYTSDIATFNELQTVLQVDKPRLVMASFSDVDLIAHSDDWNGYLDAIAIVDSLATLTWNTLQADTAYAGKTYMFISADHGRHDDAHGGFQNHGDSCEGCRHIPFLVLGPDIRAGYETTLLYTQRDVGATVGAILNVPTPLSAGVLMTEIFEPVSSGIRD